MSVNSVPPVKTFHVPAPRATEVSNGKAAESPAFIARSQIQEGSSEQPFGKLVSQIAKAKNDKDPV